MSRRARAASRLDNGRARRGPTPITPQAAAAAIAERLSTLPSESCSLASCVGRTLRQDVFAERDNPPFDRVCMDGIAIASDAFASGARRFQIEAVQAAGAPALTLSGRANAIEVMTGAVLPQGTDCVIPLEEYQRAGLEVALSPDATGAPYRNVQRRGSDSPPGVPMLRAGIRLGTAEIAVVASAGLASVQVTRQPSLVVVSTGDELIEPGLPIADYQVRRSNVYGVVAALREHGFTQVTDDHLTDNEEALRRGLQQHLVERDLLILSGGVSKGKFDLVPKVLKELAVEEVFHRVAQRPGMPMWFGVGPGGQLVFGLPGNPVSTLVCLRRYVVPALASMLGAPTMEPEPVALAAPVKFGSPLTYFLPVVVKVDRLGQASAMPRQPNGSGDFLALAGTQGFLELPPGAGVFPPGFVADLYRW